MTNAITKHIRGNDLRKMRIHSGLTSQEMASALNIKSRKTIENWERDFCEPTIGGFVLYCLHAGFNPGLIVAEIQKRNSDDPVQGSDVDLTKCLK